MPETFTEIVDSLEDGGLSGLFVQKRDNRVQVLDVFAARKIESGLEALLIQVDLNLLPRIEEWPMSEGFQIEIRRMTGRNDTSSLLCLELCSSEFREVFLALAEDICGVIRQQTDPSQAIRAMLRQLFRWQEFLRKHRHDGLSDEERAGLFGELEVLQELFLKTMEPKQAVEGWRGCRKANQDFQYPGLALEVKTTRAATPDRIHVSNVQQLDEEGIDNMFLSLVCVDQNESAGTSLPEIVADLRGGLPEAALMLFNEGLMEVGYLDSHKQLYERARYQVKEIMTFVVIEGFPRMRRNQVPAGVKGVKYQISIDACRRYLVDHEALLVTLSNLRGKPANE